MQKRPDWLMEKATSTELAALSQKMMDTLKQDLRLEMSLMQTKINSVEQKQERDVKEMKDSIQEVKQGNVMAQEKLDALFGGHVALRSEATKQHEEAKAAVLGLRSEAKKQHEEAKAAASEVIQMLTMLMKVNQADDGKKDKARLDAIKKKIKMEKIRQVDEDKVRKRATERDAIRNGRSVMFMNSLRILQERRLAARTVMNRLEVQSIEEEEAQINRDLAYERARIKWVASIWNQVEEKKAKAMQRCGKEETRRNVQSELFHVQWMKESDKRRSQWDLWTLQLGGIPATLTGLERAVMYNGKPCIILKKLQDTEDRYQVKLENGRILSVEHKNVRPDRAIPIRGATGRKEGMMNKEKEMQKKQRRKKNRIKKAIVYWKKRPLIQGTSSSSKQSRQIRISARILAYRNALELPSARELRKIICSKRNTKRKIHTGSTDTYFVAHMSYRTSLASEKREDRFQPTFRSRGVNIPHSKRNLKRKSRKGSTDVYLLKRTIELEID
jgi:hypothetical protein